MMMAWLVRGVTPENQSDDYTITVGMRGHLSCSMARNERVLYGMTDDDIAKVWT